MLYVNFKMVGGREGRMKIIVVGNGRWMYCIQSLMRKFLHAINFERWELHECISSMKKTS